MDHLNNKTVKVFFGYDQGFELVFKWNEAQTLTLELDYLSNAFNFSSHEFQENLPTIISHLEVASESLIFDPDA